VPVRVMDEHNAVWTIVKRAALRDGWGPSRLLSELEWRKLRAYEGRLCHSFDRITVVSQEDRAALESVVNRPVAVRGHTDLTVGDRKFSGNSQRRKKHFLLFHGTFLLNFDLLLVSELLPMPSKQPDYREHRAHTEFLTNLNVPANEVKAALRQTWKAEEPLDNPPLEKITALARDKYATREWNFKF